MSGYAQLRRLAGGLVVLSLWCVRTLLAAEEGADAKDAVKQLLDRGWDVSRDARQQADACFRQLPGSLEADARVQRAYLLVLLKQQRYAEATKRAEGIFGRDQQELLAWRAKIWLSLLTKKYTTGLVDIEKLSELVPAEKDLGDRADEVHELARFLGVLFGFLEGPAGTSVTPAQRELSQKKILARLDAAGKEAFEAGRNQVKQQHAALLGQQDQAGQDAERKADELREQLLKDAAAEREGVEQRRDSVTEEANRVQEEYQSQKRRLAEQEVPLTNDLTRLQAQAVVPQGELLRIRGDIARLEDLLRREKDPIQRERLRNEIDRLEIHARRHRAQLAELERAAAIVNARLAEVQRERLRVENEFGGNLGRAEGALTDLQRRASKADAAERNARKLTGDKRRTGALATRAAALTTYAPFPLEEEKQKLLRP
jgi:hypothetical protein